MLSGHGNLQSKLILLVAMLTLFYFLLNPVVAVRADSFPPHIQTAPTQQIDQDSPHFADKQAMLQPSLAPDTDLLATDVSSVPLNPERWTNLPPISIEEIFANLAARAAQTDPGISAANSPNAIQVDCSEAGLDAGLAQGGTITFNCAASTQITLTTPKEVLKDSTIDGGGKVVLSGGTLLRHFVVRNGVSFTLQNISLIEGYADYGGAVFLNQRSKLIVRNSILQRNISSVSGASLYGRDNTNLLIENSDISYNFSDQAAGVFYTEKLTTVQIQSSSFISNTATKWGGVMVIGEDSTATIVGSNFTQNVAKLQNAGTIYALSMEFLSISDSKFINNHCKGYAGGRFGYAGAAIAGAAKTLQLQRVVFEGNITDQWYGGAIEIEDSDLTMSDVIMNSNASSALNAESSKLTIVNSTFDHNSGWEGGAFRLRDSALTLTNTTFTQNSAELDGGAIDAYEVTMLVNNSTFSFNNAGHSGGAIYTSHDYDNNYGEYRNVMFTNNEAKYDGGALYEFGGADINAVSFNNNHAGGDGGALGCIGCNVQFSVFNQNFSETTGGAVYCSVGSIWDSTLSNNRAAEAGGAVYTDHTCQIGRTLFTGNSANDGGGIYISRSTTELTNVTFSRNKAEASGGAIYVVGEYLGGSAKISHGTLQANEAITGTSVYVEPDVNGLSDGKIELSNTLLWGSKPSSLCAGYLNITSHHTFASDTSCNLTGTGDRQNISNPKLSVLDIYGGATSVHMPLTGSPLLDTGECQSDILNDQRQFLRPGIAGGKCDIGAVERAPSDKDTPWPKVFLPLVAR